MPKKRNFHGYMLYLEPEKARRLSELAKQTRVLRSVLLREAVDMLLAKYSKWQGVV